LFRPKQAVGLPGNKNLESVYVIQEEGLFENEVPGADKQVLPSRAWSRSRLVALSR
jgi:hypothetical protein